MDNPPKSRRLISTVDVARHEIAEASKIKNALIIKREPSTVAYSSGVAIFIPERR
jgi:hypothetical protein